MDFLEGRNRNSQAWKVLAPEGAKNYSTKQSFLRFLFDAASSGNPGTSYTAFYFCSEFAILLHKFPFPALSIPTIS